MCITGNDHKYLEKLKYRKKKIIRTKEGKMHTKRKRDIKERHDNIKAKMRKMPLPPM